MGRGNAVKSAVLSRKQMEQILIYMRLHENVESVVILQKWESGIGPDIFARFYRKNTQSYHEIDITDVEAW